MKPIIISHRGNLEGSNPETENTNDQIMKAIEAGFDVEVDVWYRNGWIYLGHDGPQERMISLEKNYEKMWYHCKDILTLGFFIDLGRDHYNYFFHDKDNATLTNRKYIWTYPGKKLTNHSIAVLPETTDNWVINKNSTMHGICTDYPIKYGTFLS